MDDLDIAISKSRGAGASAPPPASRSTVSIGLVVGGIIVLVTAIGLFVLISSVLRGGEGPVIADTDIPLIKTEYETMKKKLVSGEVHGTVTSPSWSGKTVSFCKVEDGQIVEEDGRRVMKCSTSDVKQTTVTSDGTFVQRLQAGQYLMNIRLEKGETSDDLPARVDVKSGTHSKITISVP